MAYSTAPDGSNANHFYRLRPYAEPDLFRGLKHTLNVERFYGNDSELWGFKNQKLYNISNNSFLGGSSSPAMVSQSLAHELSFESVSGLTDVYYIKATVSGATKYLSYNSVLSWQDSATNSCHWGFERLIRFTDIPGSSIDYFSEKSGDTTGGTMPEIWALGMKKLYCGVFGVNDEEYADILTDAPLKIFINLYGARYNDTVLPSDYRGKFHTGVDINLKDKAGIHCPFEGVVAAISNRYGALAIKSNWSGDIYTFMHMYTDKEEGESEDKLRLRRVMDNGNKEDWAIGDPVQYGEKIGEQSNTGLGKSGESHLHVEIISATDNGVILSLPERSYEELGSTVPPYESFSMLPYGNPHDNPPTGGGGGDFAFAIRGADYTVRYFGEQALDYTIDWGDGTTSVVNSFDEAQRTHQYPHEGEWTITIKNYKSGYFQFREGYYSWYESGQRNEINIPTRLARVLTPLPRQQGRMDFSYMFYQCNLLEFIPKGLFDYCTEATDFSFCFFHCTTFAKIPSGLFDKCTNAKDFSSCFGETQISSIPDKLFKNCPNANDFTACFCGCQNLTTIGNGVFGNRQVDVNFICCFSGDMSLTEIPPDLFIGSSKDLSYDFSYMFTRCAGLTEIPVELFESCSGSGLYNFYETFLGCTGLTEIPAGLFDSCPGITTIALCFYDCTSLETVPDRLFKGKTQLTNAEYCFYHCSSLKHTGNETFMGCTALGDVSQCYCDCTSLVTVGDSLFEDCSSMDGFVPLFSGSINLETVGNRVFKNCSTRTDFSLTFASCTKLRSVGDEVFMNCKSTQYFLACFGGCTSLESIPDNLFIGCPNVTSFISCFQDCTHVSGTVPKLWNTHPSANPPEGTSNRCYYQTGSQGDITTNIPDNWK